MSTSITCSSVTLNCNFITGCVLSSEYRDLSLEWIASWLCLECFFWVLDILPWRPSLGSTSKNNTSSSTSSSEAELLRHALAPQVLRHLKHLRLSLKENIELPEWTFWNDIFFIIIYFYMSTLIHFFKIKFLTSMDIFLIILRD